jgi:16S rRNA A1518/A1519 N6-dimethyltransferase RsmA/KsgA/DIM1 with predicted DNA glycosylase/AP lyase activity
MSIAHPKHSELLTELIGLIEKTKAQVIAQVNSSLTVLFWGIGNKILNHVLNKQRADYGKQIVVTLSRELVKKYGQNYEEKNLRRMIQFAETYNDVEKVVTLSRHCLKQNFNMP